MSTPMRRYRLTRNPRLAALAMAVAAGALLTASGGAAQAATPVPYFNGFETNTNGWNNDGGTIVRADSSYSSLYANGVAAATGSYDARMGTGSPGNCDANQQNCSGPFTRWGGYSSTFPASGYTTETSIYLDTTWAASNPDRRFDWDVASNYSDGSFLQDFAFNAGTSPTQGTPAFVVSASNGATRSAANPSDPGRSPVSITSSGWYTFVHHFFNNGGYLAVRMSILDDSGTTVGSWTIPAAETDAAHCTGSCTLYSSPVPIAQAGGNRYGWFANQEIDGLVIDNTLLYPGTGNFTCTGILANTTVNGDVIVPPGASCVLDHDTVTGNVNLQDGGASIDVRATTVGNNLQAKNPASIIVRLGSTISHDLKVDGTTSTPVGYDFNFVCNSTIGHNLVVQNSTSTAPWVIGWVDPSACAKSNAIGNDANMQNNHGDVNFSDNNPADGPTYTGAGTGGVGHDLTASGNTGNTTVNNNLVAHNATFQGNTHLLV